MSRSLKQWIAAQGTTKIHHSQHIPHIHHHHSGGHHHHHHHHHSQYPYKSLVYNSSNYEEPNASTITSTPQHNQYQYQAQGGTGGGGMSTSMSYPSLQTSAILGNNQASSSSSSAKKSPSSNIKDIKDDIKRQKQIQYYNKLNKEEFDDLVGLGSKSSNSKFQKPNSNSNTSSSSSHQQQSNLTTHVNSRFKPVNKSRGPQIVSANSSATPGIINITTNNSANRSNKQQAQPQQQPQTVSKDTSNQIALNSKAKKQLDFFGPECWINFKFNLESLLSDLTYLQQLQFQLQQVIQRSILRYMTAIYGSIFCTVFFI